MLERDLWGNDLKAITLKKEKNFDDEDDFNDQTDWKSNWKREREKVWRNRSLTSIDPHRDLGTTQGVEDVLLFFLSLFLFFSLSLTHSLSSSHSHFLSASHSLSLSRLKTILNDHHYPLDQMIVVSCLADQVSSSSSSWSSWWSKNTVWHNGKSVCLSIEIEKEREREKEREM